MRIASVFLIAGWALAGQAMAAATQAPTEDYMREPLPPGIQVIVSELEGPVFADANGRTLYRWSTKDIFVCDDTRYRETTGLFSLPYIGGKELPEADTRPVCADVWPAATAPADAKPVGNWTIVERKDGKKQWAYKGRALYTSHLDRKPGETNGGHTRYVRSEGVDGNSQRAPVGPPPAVPPQFAVFQMVLGRLLTTTEGHSVYTFDKDTSTASYCNDSCLNAWAPVRAPDSAVGQGEWSTIKRRGGIMQWAFRGKPLYTHITDSKVRSYEGGDVPGWRNVFTQRAPRFPKGFQVADTYVGQVLADVQGKAIYLYSCAEDTYDRQACDTPESPQAYRWAICGGGDPARCLQTFPYVIADKNAVSENHAWTTLDIDPKTGRRAGAGSPGALHVWAYRGRPVYTFAGDEPGDIGADAWGEGMGQRNGFTAFWLRDDYKYMDGPRDLDPTS